MPHPQASYVRLPPAARTACRDAGVDFRESVHAAAHALLNVLPLYMVCNPSDVATECDNPYDTVRAGAQLEGGHAAHLLLLGRAEHCDW